ncbi:putative DNAJ domain protein [Leptomonas pyrrhocoris]|uniref:Putative DNAJ domain protein n=1 Tax=Leptomonas pyrrhocoris TaxID=157538 RepID=A0A0N0DV55_LEPPY|nr:putative DNAJ domain protein [Leptomonas pyrrhocoris]KPA79888.1 putative DNAJ domain protein [Leptomonas pyrrhocoris]|eukprot:XP_015658327.1 putative DNAJ domain protein [Leptomonas pyrrhocoris]
MTQSDAAPSGATNKGAWEALKEQGNQSFKTGAYLEAIQHYSAAIEANPVEAVLYSNRSAAYLKKGQYQQAAADAEKAVEIDNTFAKVYSRLHNALCNLGKFDRAIEMLKAGVAAVSASPRATPQDTKHLRELLMSAEQASKAVPRGRQLIEEGAMAAAGRTLAPAYREFPDCAVLAFLYAESHAASSPDEASKVLSPFAYAHSSDPHYLYLRALVLYYRGQDGFSSAQNILRETLQMDPDNAEARVLLKKIRAVEAHKDAGNNAFKNKNAKEAVDAYTLAIDCDPANSRMNATLRSNRAAAKMLLNDFKGALLDCDYAINNGATSAKVYARRSRIQEQLERFEDAVRDLQQAAEMDKQFEGELRQLKGRAKRAKRKDYYKVLSLPQKESNQDVIKRSYKKACLQWHPDKWANASEEEKSHAEVQFKEIGEAFGVLSDPQKKRLYDSGQMDNDVEGANMGSGGFGGASQEDFVNVMNMMFGGGGGGFHSGGFSSNGFHAGGFQPGGFGGMPGSAGGRRRPRGGPPSGFYQF